MAGGNNEREGLLTTIRARREWYLALFFLQMACWAFVVFVNEVRNGEPADSMAKRIQESAVIMAFIGQGTVATTILLIDVVYDGLCKVCVKGGEIVGLLFSPSRNRFVVEGEKKSDEKWSAWLKQNPEVQRMITDGEIEAPPRMVDKGSKK